MKREFFLRILKTAKKNNFKLSVNNKISRFEIGIGTTIGNYQMLSHSEYEEDEKLLLLEYFFPNKFTNYDQKKVIFKI